MTIALAGQRPLATVAVRPIPDLAATGIAAAKQSVGDDLLLVTRLAIVKTARFVCHHGTASCRASQPVQLLHIE